MPELPEVETIARTLAPQVEGRRIVACELLNPSTFEGPILLGKAIGGTIGRPGRRGKLLLLPLAFNGEPVPLPDPVRPSGSLARHLASGDERITGLGFHLKMTGRLFVYPEGTPPEKHTRLLFDLDDGSRLFFDDARKFGYARVLSPASVAAWPFWNALGPEPLEMDADAFAARFAGRRGKIKALLLDQSVVAGCGNIYADESLFRAGIRPDAQLVSPDRLKRLHAALREVLLESIDACGSSIRDYRTARGDAGAFQNAFRVYGRSGQTCLECGAALEGCRIAGRATVFCPNCQRA